MSDLFSHTPAPTYPNAPGYKDRDTSREAAESMTSRAPVLRQRCLRAISAAIMGLTADQVAELLGETVLAVRPRITELLQLGKIKDSGTRRANASGRSAKVWIAA